MIIVVLHPKHTLRRLSILVHQQRWHRAIAVCLVVPYDRPRLLLFNSAKVIAEHAVIDSCMNLRGLVITKHIITWQSSGRGLVALCLSIAIVTVMPRLLLKSANKASCSTQYSGTWGQKRTSTSVVIRGQHLHGTINSVKLIFIEIHHFIVVYVAVRTPVDISLFRVVISYCRQHATLPGGSNALDGRRDWISWRWSFPLPWHRLILTTIVFHVFLKFLFC